VLAIAAEPGLVTPAGSFFGFVIGGRCPPLWLRTGLTAVWDQNAAFAMLAPAEGTVEAVAARWLFDLFALPPTASVGFVTGGAMAGLPAWPRPGMGCLPRPAGMSRLGSGAIIVATDRRIQPDDLAAALSRVSGPVIVYLQAGNVNTGSCDPFRPAIQAATD
jgi:glutamate/tyrosine decarboxylase-like PLP-dependent enzyme